MSKFATWLLIGVGGVLVIGGVLYFLSPDRNAGTQPPLEAENTLEPEQDSEPKEQEGEELTINPADLGPMQSYQYVRWEILENSDLEGSCSGSGCIQVAELALIRDTETVAWPENTVATNVDGNSPPGETPANAVDGNVDTKWLDLRFSLGSEAKNTGNSILVIDAGEPISFNGYTWATANDGMERDPVTWRLYGSNDGESWTLLDARADLPVTDARKTFAVYYSLQEVQEDNDEG